MVRLAIYFVDEEPSLFLRAGMGQRRKRVRYARGDRSAEAKHGHRQRGRRKTAPTLEALRARRGEILAIAAKHGARNVRVFGSVACGYAGPDSDVDFLVELEPQRTVLDLSGLILDLEEALGHRVHVVEIWEPSPVAERIEREAVPL